MRVAGLGFRSDASAEALSAALAAALARTGGAVDALATIAQRAAALQRAFPGRRVIAVDVTGVLTLTQSPRIQALHGTGSVAEAAALVAAGPGARLVLRRQVCGPVTLALAETPEGASE